MEIWLKQDKKALQIPILPASFAINVAGGHQTVNIQTKGEVSIIGKRGLETIDFTSFFPAQDYPFASYAKDREPYDYVKTVRDWMEKAVRLTITDTNINSEFLITNFSYGEPDGSGDVEYSISLQEYRKPTYTKPKKELPPASLGNSSGLVVGKEPTRPTSKPKQKTYTVKSGDCLWNIAKKYYGSGTKASKIYNANKALIEKTAKKYGHSSSYNKGVAGWWIFPGMKLVIP